MADGASRKLRLYFALLAREFSDVVGGQRQPRVGLIGYGPHVGPQFKEWLESGGEKRRNNPPTEN